MKGRYVPVQHKIARKQKRCLQPQNHRADSPVRNQKHLSGNCRQAKELRPADHLPGFTSALYIGVRILTKIPRDGRQVPASKGERTLLFMESAKPTIFLEPTEAAAARGQVLVRARVAVRRATESMVLIGLVGLLMLGFL